MRKKKGKELIRHVMKRNRIEAKKKRLEEKEKHDYDYEIIPLPYQSLDKNGDVLDVNDKWLDMLGYTKKEVVGRNFSKFIKEKDDFKKRFLKFKACGVTKDADFVMLKKNGEEIDVTIDGKVKYDKKGDFVQTHCILKNVTEQRKTEETLTVLVKSTVETGQDFFDNLSKNLCRYLNVDCVIISEVKENIVAKAVSMHLKGKKITDYSYQLAGTPCENVTKKGYCHYPDNVAKLFPEDTDLKDMKARGYIGSALRDKKGKVIGIICVISRNKIEISKKTENLLKIIASRVASEIERKKAEEMVAESEKKYRGLFENMQDGFAYHKIVLDKNKKPVDYIFLEVNSSFEKYTGLKKKEIIGKKVTKVIPGIKKAKPDLISVYGGIALAGNQKKFELYFEPFKKWYLISCYSPKKEYFVVTFSDITETKKIEKQVKEGEEKYKSLFDNSRDAIMTLEPPTWQFTSGNSATVEMFGAKDEKEFTSLGPGDVSPKFQPDGRLSSDKAKVMIGKAMKNGSNFFEWTHKKINGEDFPATVLLSRMNLGKKTFLQATVRNISNQKKADESLKNERDFITNILNTMGDGVDIVNEDCEIEFMNKAFLDVFGKKAIGKKCYEIYKIDKKQCHACPLKGELEPGKTSSLEVSGIVGNATFQITHTAFRDKDDKIKIIEIFSDISNQKLAEDELNKKVEELEKFQKIIVGREMKMVELKEKLESKEGGK